MPRATSQARVFDEVDGGPAAAPDGHKFGGHRFALVGLDADGAAGGADDGAGLGAPPQDDVVVFQQFFDEAGGVRVEHLGPEPLAADQLVDDQAPAGQALGQRQAHDTLAQDGHVADALEQPLRLLGLDQRVEGDDALEVRPRNLKRNRLRAGGHQQPVVPDALAAGEEEFVLGRNDLLDPRHEEQVDAFAAVGVTALEDEFREGEVVGQEIAQLAAQVERVRFFGDDGDAGVGIGAAEGLGRAVPGGPVADDDEVGVHDFNVQISSR